VEPTSRLLLERTLSKWAPRSPPGTEDGVAALKGVERGPILEGVAPKATSCPRLAASGAGSVRRARPQVLSRFRPSGLTRTDDDFPEEREEPLAGGGEVDVDDHEEREQVPGYQVEHRHGPQARPAECVFG